jgi:hypothetical protein
MVIYVLERYLQLGNVRLRLGTLFNVLERINRIFRVSENKTIFFNCYGENLCSSKKVNKKL